MSFKTILFQREPEVAEAPVKDWGYREGEDEVVELEDEPVTPVVEDVAIAEPVKVEDAPAEVIPPVVESKPVEVTAVDWKSALKKVDKYEALKELGYDDFTIDLLKYKEKTGDFTPYLQVKTVDYLKMTPEQLLKTDLQKQNAGMSEKALEFKFKKEFNEKYYLDRDEYREDSDEAVYGQEQLRLDAEAKRKQFIEEQAIFKAPEPKPDTSAQERETALNELQGKQKEVVLNNPVTKTLQSAKSIQFGQGEESFNYPIENVDPIINGAVSTLQGSDTTEVTEAQMHNFYQSLAIAADLPGFLKKYGDHQFALAKKKFQAEVGNITPVNTAGVIDQEQNLTPAQQLARNGRFV